MKKLLILTILIATAAVVLAQTGVSRSPNSSRECTVCHYEWAEPFLTEQRGTEIARFPQLKEVADERMCFSCHDGSVGDSRFQLWGPHGENHKTGTPLQEGMNPPPILPLDNGKITCMTCHSAHGTPDGSNFDIENSIFLRVPNTNSQLCRMCHTDMQGKQSHPLEPLTGEQLERFKPGTLRLSANNTVVCTTCHEPHGAPDVKLLRASGAGMELCKNCHFDQFPAPDGSGEDLAFGHVVGLEVDEDSIMAAIVRRSGQLGPGGELICFTCHTIHKAEGDHLLNRSNVSSAFCRDCHTGQDGVFDTPHNMLKAADYVTVDGESAAEVGVCSSCHGAHEWQQAMPRIQADEITKMCLSCHNSTGVAAKKAINWDMYNHYTGDINAGQTAIMTNPMMKRLPENTRNFLNRYFTGGLIPRGMKNAGMVTCLTCHDVHDNKKMFLREEASDGTLCTSCHEEQKPVIATVHGNEKLTRSCLSCHEVHNSPDKLFVRNGGVDDGCTACHTSAVSPATAELMRMPMPGDLVLHDFNHPVNIDNSTRFPMPMKQREDGRFTCTSCHNPHGGQDNVPLGRNFLWADSSVRTMDAFCLTCHDSERAVVGSDHAPDPLKPKVANIRTGRPAETCDNCHRPHNAFTEKYIYAVEGSYRNKNDFCSVCHNPAGEAPEKSIDVMRGHRTGKLDKIPEVTAYLDRNHDGTYSLSCLSCHDAHRNGPAYGMEGDFASSFLKELDPAKYNMCLACHDSMTPVLGGLHFVDRFERQDDAVVRKVVTRDVCGVCHDIHNSNPVFLMAGLTSEERCLSCHRPGEMSVMSVFDSHEKDVEIKDKNRADLPLENHKIVCSTCHDPHLSVKALVRTNTDQAADLCISCHRDQQPVMVSKHNLVLDGIRDRSMAEAALFNTCQPCHGAHNFPAGNAYMWPRPVNMSRDFNQGACVDCHNPSGTAAVKTPEYLNHSRVLKMFPLQAQYRELLRGFDGKMSPDGEISCSTCHDPHVWSNDPLKADQALYVQPLDGDTATSFLKAGVVDGFCDVCHDDARSRYDKFHTSEFRDEGKGLKRGLLRKLINIGG